MKHAAWAAAGLAIWMAAGVCPLPAEASRVVELRVVAEKAPVRLDPDPDAAVLETLARGDVLKAVRTVEDWYEVELPPNEQGFARRGFVLRSQVETVDPETVPAAEPQPRPEPHPPVRPQAPAPREEPEAPAARAHKAVRLYVNGEMGFGIGFSRIQVANKIVKDRTSEVYIHPGGGMGLQLGFGVRLFEALLLELGAGMQSSGEVLSGGKALFSRFPLSAEIKYLLPGDKTRVFFGAGAALFAGAELKVEDDTSDLSISYGSPVGVCAEIGAHFERPTSPWFLFAGAKYMGVLGGYTWRKANFIPVSSVRNMSAQGIFLSFGIGYLLN